MAFCEAETAAAILMDWPAATETDVLVLDLVRSAAYWWPGYLLSDLSQLLFEVAITAVWTVAQAVTRVRFVASSVASTSSADRHRDALNNTSG